jgi:hypothetical protein
MTGLEGHIPPAPGEGRTRSDAAPMKPAVPPGAAMASERERRPAFGPVVAVGAAAVTLAAIRLLWASRDWPLVHDGPLMHYVAWRILDGAAPYRDLFDMNFPGVYVAHLLLLRVLGPGDHAFRAFDVSLVALTGAGLWMGLRFAGPWGGPTAAALFALYHVAGGPWLAGQRELLLCAGLAWAAAATIASDHASGAGRLRWIGVAALAMGGALWVKPHAALLAPALAWWAWRGPDRRRAVVSVVVGLALPAIAILGWVGWTGGLGAFADITFGYLIPLYSRLGRSDVLHELAARDYGVTVLAGLAGGAGLGAAALARGRHRVTLGVLATGLVYGAAHFWIQGRGWEYHFYPLALFATALAGAGLGVSAADRRPLFTVGLLLSVAVTAGALWTKGWVNLAPDWIEARLVRVDRLATSLRPIVEAGGMVQVLDTTEGGVHALLRLRARQPSRFVYDFHFHHDVGHVYVRRLRGELMSALRSSSPAAVVVLERGWPVGGYERLSGFPELWQWLMEGYGLVQEGDGFRLYQRTATR